MNSKLFLLSLLVSSIAMAGECVINMTQPSVYIPPIIEQVIDEKACRETAVQVETKHNKKSTKGVDIKYKYTGSEVALSTSSFRETSCINSKLNDYDATINQIITRNSVLLETTGRGGLCNWVRLKLIQDEKTLDWSLKSQSKKDSFAPKDKEELIQIVQHV